MKKPSFLKDAIATPKGYVNSKGELLKAAKLTQDQIDAFNGVEEIKEVIEPKKTLEEIKEIIAKEDPFIYDEPEVEEETKSKLSLKEIAKTIIGK